MRLFVALELPSAVRENLAALLKALREASPNLKTLAAEIDCATEKLGIPREQRPFAPHLTLARFEPPELPEKLRSAIQENAAREFGSFRTNQYFLIGSKLKPSGAEYTTLESFPFAAAEA